MTLDRNKDITAITYNHLNLPDKVTKGTGDYVKYTYDATGRKLSQGVYNASNVLKKKSDYAGEFFYENDTLKFVNHEEGRVVMTGTAQEYQYHLKDHLGNVRMTFTTKDEIENVTATMETASATAEHNQFLNYDEAVKVNSSLFNHTPNGTTHYSTRLRGSTNEQYGLAKSLSVMPGDTIRIEVFAKYVDPNSGNWQQALSDLMTAIANGTAPTGTVVDGGLAGSIGNATFPYGGLLDKTAGGTPPKAFLNYIMFDRDVNPILDPEQTNFIQVSELARETGANGDHERLYAQVIAKQAGLMYIHLSNDNVELGGPAVEVFFDDFRVEHVKSPVIQMDDYYPFGLTFNSYARENTMLQNYQYNGKERQDELGLGWSDFGARMYNPQIGRWGVIDPHADKYEIVTPYNYAFNSPLLFVDPTGKDNIIYLLAAGDFDKKQAAAIAAQATAILRDLGLEIEVKFFDEGEKGAFDPNGITATDNWAVIGDNRKAVAKKARSLDKIDDTKDRYSNGKSSYEYAIDEWENKPENKSHPEVSNRNGKNGIVVDYYDSFSDKRRNMNAALMVDHGAAHSSAEGSKSHVRDNLGIFADGAGLDHQYQNGGYEAILEKQRNDEYILLMMQRYSSPKAVDKYPYSKKK